jgi:uncharacterized protein with HEPN domain
MKDDRLYLIHIGEAIDKIESYSADGRAYFLGDPKTQDAVLRNLQTLAESSQRVTDERKARHPDVDWRTISALRNVLVHDYLGLSVERIWDIVETDLPVLKRQILAMLAEETS